MLALYVYVSVYKLFNQSLLGVREDSPATEKKSQ